MFFFVYTVNGVSNVKTITVLALIIGTGKNNYFDHCSAVFRTQINC